MSKLSSTASTVVLTLLVFTLVGRSADSSSVKKSTPAATATTPRPTLEMLFFRWIVDESRFEESFSDSGAPAAQSGTNNLSDAERERRRQNLSRQMGAMPSYTFSKSKDSDLKLTIAVKNQPNREKALKAELPPALGSHFSFTDEKKERCEIVVIDRDRITLTIHTAGRTVVLPLARTILPVQVKVPGTK